MIVEFSEETISLFAISLGNESGIFKLAIIALSDVIWNGAVSTLFLKGDNRVVLYGKLFLITPSIY